MNRIIILSDAALNVAQKIRDSVGGVIEGLASRCSKVDVLFEEVKPHMQAHFQNGDTIIAVMATGAIVRMIAPVITNKYSDPPVVSVAEDGTSVVPVIGGHHGSNDIARILADALGGFAAVTTAGDLRFGIALDAPPEGWTLANPENAKTVMAAILGGEEVRLQGRSLNQAKWLMESNLPLDDDGECVMSISETAREYAPLELVYYPKRHVVGIGCERGTEPEEILSLLEEVLEREKIPAACIAGVTSIDLKADEAAINAVAKHLDVPLRIYNAATLEQETPRLENPSEIVFAEVGCHGVAEGSALTCVGPEGVLKVPKQKSKRATLAIAQAPEIIDMATKGRKRGKLFVLGIGPGSEAWRSPEVTRMVQASTDLVGYSLYLDLIAEISQGKVRHDFDLGKEEDRVRHAMELAGEGKDVALVCSGDAGIYAMATLVFELLDGGGLSDAASRIAIEVSPGISALQGAAARAGAPLGHDFCTISLSDLLTPWDAIQMRVKAAAEGDFVIAFYNPVSKRRRTQLEYAKGVLLEHRPIDTPVILATNLGRDGELVRVVPLGELDINEVDMLTVVIVGSSDTKTVKTGDGKTWVYTPRGYAAKEGTALRQAQGEEKSQ